MCESREDTGERWPGEGLRFQPGSGGSDEADDPARPTGPQGVRTTATLIHGALSLKTTATVLDPEDLLPAARKYSKCSLLSWLPLEGTARDPGTTRGSVPGSPLPQPCPGTPSRLCSFFCPDVRAEPTLGSWAPSTASADR